MTQPPSPDAYDKLIEARLDYLARQRTRNRRAFALVLACVVIALVAAASCDVWRGRAGDSDSGEGCAVIQVKPRTHRTLGGSGMISASARPPRVSWIPDGQRRTDKRPGPRVK